jgi:hypothetical protein
LIGFFNANLLAKGMERSILNHGSPEIQEARRIAEIKALSYEERIKRLFALIEISFKIRNGKLQNK